MKLTKYIFVCKKEKSLQCSKNQQLPPPHSRIVLEFQSSKLRLSPTISATAVVQLKGSSIAKLETSYKIQWMASGTSISILYLVAKEIRKKEEKVDAYLDLLNSFFYFFAGSVIL